MLEPLLSQLNNMRVVLASSSKQRADLLRNARLKFEIVSSDYEENLNPNEHTYSDFVEKTALGKLHDVLEKLKNDFPPVDVIIACDTMVTHNGRMYGKPKSKDDAIKIISELSQQHIPHCVYSGVAVWFKTNIHKFTEVTTVHMAHLSDEEIRAYVETGEPMGKAGGYAIQGIASSFVTRIEGDVNNVIGLPLCRLSLLLRDIFSKV